MQVMTLAELAKLRGSSITGPLFDLCAAQYPETIVIPGRPIPGIVTSIPVRKALPHGGFRKANSPGVLLTASEYDYFTVSAYIFDTQLSVDEMVAEAHPFGKAAFLADELEANLRGSLAILTEQLYYGDAASSDGYQGFATFIGNADRLLVDGGASAGAGIELSSAFVARVSTNNGVCWAYGNNGQFMAQEEWQRVQERTALLTSTAGATRAKTVLTNGSAMWLGLQYYPTSVVRICNVDVSEDATDHITDHMIATAIKRFPAAYPPTHIFMNSDMLHSLRLSRSLGATGIQTTPGAQQLAPIPTESSGLPIVVTDGISSDEDEVS